MDNSVKAMRDVLEEIRTLNNLRFDISPADKEQTRIHECIDIAISEAETILERDTIPLSDGTPVIVRGEEIRARLARIDAEYLGYKSMAAMHVALTRIAKLTREYVAGDHFPTDYPQMVLDTVSTALDWLPRNCDRFSTLAAATDAWRVENRTWQWGDGYTAVNYMTARASQDVGEFLVWLFAPAKGGQ